MALIFSACQPTPDQTSQSTTTPVPTPSTQQVQIIGAERPVFIENIRANYQTGYPPQICIAIDLSTVFQSGQVANQFVQHYVYGIEENVRIQVGNQAIPSSRILAQSDFVEQNILNDVGNVIGSVIDLAYCFDVPVLPDGLYDATIFLTQMDRSQIQFDWRFQLVKN